jgi:predicted nucleic-acid-binding protein
VIAIDTNVIVRLLTKDDKNQYDKSYNLLQNEDVFITDTVILETEWVLRFAYDFPFSEICHAFRQLFGLKNVTLTNAQLVAQVIDWYESGLDFADAFHLANTQNVDAFKTFDEKFIKRSKGLTNCVVEKP